MRPSSKQMTQANEKAPRPVSVDSHWLNAGADVVVLIARVTLSCNRCVCFRAGEPLLEGDCRHQEPVLPLRVHHLQVRDVSATPTRLALVVAWGERNT